MAKPTRKTQPTDPTPAAGPSVHTAREIAFKLGALAEAAQRFAEDPEQNGRLISVLGMIEDQAEALEELAR